MFIQMSNSIQDGGRVIIFKYHLSTLESGIDVAPGINVVLPLKNFHIRILIHFFINQGIAVIFSFFFSKINKRNPMFIPESRV